MFFKENKKKKDLVNFYHEPYFYCKKEIKNLKGMIISGHFGMKPLSQKFKFPIINVFDDNTCQTQVCIDDVSVAHWPSQQAIALNPKKY